MPKTCECTFNLYKLYVTCPEDESSVTAKDIGSKLASYYKNQQAVKRVLGLEEGLQDGRLLAHLSKSLEVVRGVVYHWENGAAVPEIHVPKEGENIEVTPVNAKKRPVDALAEMGKGMCFFAIYGDYIACCSKSATPKLLSGTFTDILNLKRKAALSVEFLPIPAPEWTDEILHKAKKIHIRPTLGTEACQDGKYCFNQRSQKFLSFIKDVRQRFTQDISSEIVLDVSLRLRNKRYRSDVSQRLISSLAKQLLGMPGWCVVLDDDKVLTAEEIRIKEVMTVPALNKMPQRDEVLSKLTDWLLDNLPRNADV